MRRLERLVAAGCLLTLLLVSRTSLAQESIDEFLWGGKAIVVTATGEEEHPFEAPATVVVVTEEVIRERGYLDLTDLLADLPGFDLSTHVYGEFATLVSQRGIGGNNKMVLLLDGQEITDPDGKEFPFGHNIPLSMARRIEVVYGPASALYGPRAFGVVNIITKAAEQVPGVTVEGAGGPHQTGHASLLAAKKLAEDVSAAIYGRIYVTDGQDLSAKYPELTRIRSYPSSVRNRMEDPVRDWNLYGTVRLKDLTLGYWHSAYRQQLADGLDPSEYVYNREAFWGQRITGLRAKHAYKRGSFSLTEQASFTTYELDPDMNWYYLIEGATPQAASTLKVYQYAKTNGTKFEAQMSYRPSSDFGVIAGTVFQDITGMGACDIYGAPFKPGSLLYVNNYGFPQAAVSSQNYGLYSQVKWRLRDEWSAIGGVRYDYNTIYGRTINPRAGLIYRSGGHSLKLLYGSAFITPSYSHLYETWFVEEYGHIQNPHIRPEKMHTVEAVWSGKWKERLETSMSVYHNWVDDLIVRRFYGDIRMSDPFVDANGDNAVFVEWNDNFGRLRSYGADLQANAVVNRSLKAYLNYSLMGGVNTDPNTGVEYNLFKTSAHKVSTGFTWTLFDRLSISPRLRWVSDIATRQENALYAGARMPGYHLVDLQVRLLRTAPGLDLHMAVNNLLNETYYTSGVGSESGVYMPRVPQQKRSMLIGMTYHLGK